MHDDSEADINNLLKGTLVQSAEPIKGIEIYLKPGETSDEEMLQFSYQYNKFDHEKLSIELIFDHPEHVSYNQEPEKLVISLNDFRDRDGNLIAEDMKLDKVLPTQTDTSTAEAISSVA